MIKIDDMTKFDWSTCREHTVRYDGKLLKFNVESLRLTKDELKRYDKKFVYIVNDHAFGTYVCIVNLKNAECSINRKTVEKAIYDGWRKNNLRRLEDTRRKHYEKMANLAKERESNTYTAFDWRVKLWSEHNLLLTHEPYSAGRMQIRVAHFDPKVIDRKNGRIKTSQVNSEYVGTVAVDGIYTDNTIAMVVAKVKEIHEKEIRKNNAKLLELIDLLDG